MNHVIRDLEELFVEAALAEEREFPSPVDDFHRAMAALECTMVDVAFAEDGEFTESACLPRILFAGTTADLAHA